METNKTIKLQFNNELVALEKIGHLCDMDVYQSITYDYTEPDVQSILTIKMEVKPLNEMEKRMVQFKIGKSKSPRD